LRRDKSQYFARAIKSSRGEDRFQEAALSVLRGARNRWAISWASTRARARVHVREKAFPLGSFAIDSTALFDR
jgi:hypothetical protein